MTAEEIMKMIEEKMSEEVVKGIEELMRKNPYLKEEELKREDIYEFRSRYMVISSETIKHIMDRHTDLVKNRAPGSSWRLRNWEELRELILEVVGDRRPSEEGGGMVKWQIDIGREIGGEGVERAKSREELEGMERYEHRDREGRVTDTVRVSYGSQRPSSYVNIISSEIGEVKGKLVNYLITAFPGKNGNEIKRRSDFEKAGYYFVIEESVNYSPLAKKG